MNTIISKSLPIKKLLLLVVFGALVFTGFVNTQFVSHAAALTAEEKAQKTFDNKCKGDFLGMKPWYAYMPRQEFNYDYNGFDTNPKTKDEANPCSIKCFNFFTPSTANDCDNRKSDIPGVLLAIVDDLLRLAGIVALAYVLISGIQYIISQGKPEDTAKAQSTLINAFIGLVIALVAVAFVSFLGNKIGG